MGPLFEYQNRTNISVMIKLGFERESRCTVILNFQLLCSHHECYPRFNQQPSQRRTTWLFITCSSQQSSSPKSCFEILHGPQLFFHIKKNHWVHFNSKKDLSCFNNSISTMLLPQFTWCARINEGLIDFQRTKPRSTFLQSAQYIAK